MCNKSVTGKKTLNFVSIANSFLPLCGIWNFLNENKVITGTADARRVEAVGTKIKLAAEKYLNSLGQKNI
jgi:hypothetical protein